MGAVAKVGGDGVDQGAADDDAVGHGGDLADVRGGLTRRSRPRPEAWCGGGFPPRRRGCWRAGRRARRRSRLRAKRSKGIRWRRRRCGPMRAGGVVGAMMKMFLKPWAREAASSSPASSGGQSSASTPSTPAATARRDEVFHARREDHVVVGVEDDGHRAEGRPFGAERQFAYDCKTASVLAPASSARCAASWLVGPSARGSGEGQAEFKDIHAAGNQCAAGREGGGRVGVAPRTGRPRRRRVFQRGRGAKRRRCGP